MFLVLSLIHAKSQKNSDVQIKFEICKKESPYQKNSACETAIQERHAEHAAFMQSLIPLRTCPLNSYDQAMRKNAGKE